MKKRVFVLLLVVCVIASVSALPVHAAPVGIVITPQWTNCSSVTLAMSYANGKVSWSGGIIGDPDTVLITASYKLEKKESNGTYSFVGEWTGYSTTKTYLNSTSSVSAPKGTYKLTVNATVKSSSGYSEPVTDSHEKTFT